MSVAPNVSMVKDAFKTETHDVGIDKVIAGIRDGRWRECIAEIRRETDKETASKLKTCLPGITPSGIFSARKNGALVQHSGLLCADLDNLNGELLSAREKLLGSPYLYSLFTSPSGGGLKAFFRVPADGAKHRRSFRAVEKHVKELTGVQVNESCKDPARLCFVSYDPRTYYNPDAIELQPLPEPEKAKSVSNGEISPDLPLRERIATELLGPMTWSAEKGGHFCQCPGEALHGNATADRHAIVYLGGSPTLKCQHTSCSRIVEAFNTQLRSLLGKAERANVQDRVTPSGRRTGAANGHSDRQYAFCDLSKIGAKAVDWIEEPYLARGEMHFLQGQGGSYKGTLALTWAAEFSRRGENVRLFWPRMTWPRR